MEKLFSVLLRPPFNRFQPLICYMTLGFSSIFLFSCSPKEKKDIGDAPPNIIVIVADDLGWHDVGFHGSEIKTPVLDQLVSEGIELDRFYVHSVCSPTRAALLTGKQPGRFGILGTLGDAPAFPKGTMTIAGLLKQKGYKTGITGKWHLGTVPAARPLNFGFTSSYGYLRGQIDPYTHLYKFGNKTWHRNDTLIDEVGHVTDLITEEAIRFINRANDEGRPFFLYVAYSAPHYPLDEPEDWIEPYKATIPNDSRRLFAAAVSHMDHAIGRMMETLKNKGVDNNTILWFFSDNGAQKNWLSAKKLYAGRFKPNDVLGDNGPLRGWKGSLYDGALRVPAFVRWKGKLQPGKTTEFINVTDIFPTVAFITDAEVPRDLNIDGENIWPLLKGNPANKEKIMYWRMFHKYALVKGDWKIIHRGDSLDAGLDELYNIRTDPLEGKNVAAVNPEIKIRLLKELKYQKSKDAKTIRKD